MFAFVDGAVDLNRRLDRGGAGFGGIGVVLMDETEGTDISSYRIVGVPFWPQAFLITNNTMELFAAHTACHLIRQEIEAGESVEIWSDSTYVKGMLSFGSQWMAKKNVELVSYFRHLTARPNVTIHHCRGHSGFAWNELADTAAQKATELRKGFDANIKASIGKSCIFCERFPCLKEDRGFGKTTSKLSNSRAYSGKTKCADRKSLITEGARHV